MNKVIWLLRGRPYKEHAGFRCRVCGKFWNIPFRIPAYQSLENWAERWGVCPVPEITCNKHVFTEVRLTIERLFKGEELSYSKTIAGTPTCGFGEQSTNGVFEYEVTTKMIAAYRKSYWKP